MSFKYAEMGSSRALVALDLNHGRPIARSYLKALGDAVGAVSYTHLTLPTNREV